MGLETLKTTGLESKPYAVRERVAPIVGEHPRVAINTGCVFWPKFELSNHFLGDLINLLNIIKL